MLYFERLSTSQVRGKGKASQEENSGKNKKKHSCEKSIFSLLRLMSLSSNYGNDFDQAILLLAWSIVEGALRMYNYTGKTKSPMRSSKSVVRDAVMIGFITQTEGEFLDYIADIRNRIAHGAVETKIRGASLKKLVKLCESLVFEVESENV